MDSMLATGCKLCAEFLTQSYSFGRLFAQAKFAKLPVVCTGKYHQSFDKITQVENACY